MSKKVKPKSYSIEPSQINEIDNTAEKLKVSSSEVMRRLIRRFLHVVADDQNQIPIVFKIPNDLTKDPEKLRTWLNTRTNALVTKLCS